MITLIVLALLGIALLAVFRAMFRTPAAGQPAIPAGHSLSPQAPAQTLPSRGIDVDVWDARKGDVVSINAAAEDFSDIDFAVDRRSAYQAKNHRWIDLSGEFRGVRVYLEVYRFPQPDLIGILDSRNLTIAEIGITEQQLTDLDARQDPAAYIQFEGHLWHFESSREIGYLENEAGEGEGLYRWLLREQDSPRLLCIEKWEGEPFEVRIARRLKPLDITVYRAA